MNKRFEVIDGANAYYLHDLVTGLEACMGDGVDWAFPGGDAPEWRPTFAEIGTEEFLADWQRDVDENQIEYFDAYFPRLAFLEVYDNGGKTIDRYTLLVEPSGAHYAGRELWMALALSINADSPQGFSLWVEAVRQSDLGERIHFLDLPENVQAHAAKRILEED